MTAASRHHSSPSLRGSLSQRLERIVLLLVVCVPVPAVALSGLNVPLPSIVERAAAALVPWANVATLDAHALAAGRGAIVLAAGQEVDAAGSVDVEPAVRQMAPPRTRAHAPRPAMNTVDGTSSRSRTELAGPDTLDRVPAAPAKPRGDEGGRENPPPAPTEPTPEPADEPGGNVPAAPPVTPSPEPTPDQDPEDRDKKPVDEVTPTTPPAPANETDVTPPDPDRKPPHEKPVDKDLPPPAEEQPGHAPDIPPRRNDNGANANGSGK